MDPRILILLKVLDIASALFQRVSERQTADEEFIVKVRGIIIEHDGVPLDEDFAELLEEGDSLVARLEELVERKRRAQVN